MSSLRNTLLVWILLPVAAFIALDTWSLHRKTLESLNTAYDRTLLASARSIGEQLSADDRGVQVAVPYAALEIFEADNRSRLFYRVQGFTGELVSGYQDMPPPPALAAPTPYAALVSFYDGQFRGEPVRVAALYQPVATQTIRGMALVQVAETLEIRHAEARVILRDVLLRQGLLLLVLSAVVTGVVRFALKPVERVRRELLERKSDDLSPLRAGNLHDAPAELVPVFSALNEVMARLERLTRHQQEFIRNASHQLRTPLAVMKTQLALAERGDLSHSDALQALSATADRATHLTNQLLALAKIEQIRSNAQFLPVNVAEVSRTIALELSPLIADKTLDFELELQPETSTLCQVLGHEWMLRELVRNLLANAIAHTPVGGKLGVRVLAGTQGTGLLQLVVWNESAPIPDELLARLFTPFSGNSVGLAGVGLGLAICKDVCDWLGGSIALEQASGVVSVCATLPVMVGRGDGGAR